jgi:beta-galactosidase
MHSRMYPRIEDIVKFAKENDTGKPMVLCEFGHAMGNGPGNLKEYIDAFYEHPRLQGGFVWEWANHGLVTKNAEGEEYFAYGGDFGDLPNDYNFVMDGLLNSDHAPTPGLLEYSKVIEPIQLTGYSMKRATIINRYDFKNLDDIECSWSLSDEHGVEKDKGRIDIPTGTEPGQTAELTLPNVGAGTDETYINLSFRLKEATLWADAGFEVATGQIPVTNPVKSYGSSSLVDDKVVVEPLSHGSLLLINSNKSKNEWQFDTMAGALASWKMDGIERLAARPTLDFWRAPTDNDGKSKHFVNYDGTAIDFVFSAPRRMGLEKSTTATGSASHAKCVLGARQECFCDPCRTASGTTCTVMVY